MAKKYLDVDLRIWRSPDGLCAAASSKYGATGPVSLESPFLEGELEAWLAHDGLLRRDLEAVTGGSQTPPRKVQDLGRRFFAAIFQGGILRFWGICRERARQSRKAIRLRLILQDSELWNWPWELLADPDGDLLVASPDVSIVRYLEVPKPPPALKVKPPIRVLVAVSDPHGNPRLDHEQELATLKSLLKTGRKRRRWKLELLEHATLSDLEQKLEEKHFHILHFIGHGALDREREEGVLLFETKEGRPALVSGGDLAAIIRDHSSIALVFLNACEGGCAPRDDPFAGVAQSLIRGGIPAVVAMQAKVADAASLVFSRVLYRNLSKGASLDEAVYKGRRALIAGGFGFECANPVLYMRAADGRIFRIPPWWVRWLVAAAGILLVATLGTIFRNNVRVWLSPAPPAVSSDPGCFSPPGLNMPFARIDPGRFSMGSGRGSAEERPAHEVEITRPYCIGKFEVTQRQWRRIMGENPSRHKGDHLPVEGVSWTEVQKFLAGLNRIDPAGRYRLPTEAEWEFAAVTGGGSVDAEKISRYGNCLGMLDGFSKTARVGVFKPNSRGVFDLYGNVSEWTSDWYESYSAGNLTDPKGPVSGTKKVRRGGYFDNSPTNCTATYRSSSKPDRQAEDTGFRVVRDVITPR
jgi:formylglycine-generating enzyme required for sulfatase activity